MGCGASSGLAVDPSGSVPRTDQYDCALQAPVLRVQTLNPDTARCSWSYAGSSSSLYDRRVAVGEGTELGSSLSPTAHCSNASPSPKREHTMFVLEMDDGQSTGFAQVYIGTEDVHDVPIAPGATLSLRVCAHSEGGSTEWSNVVTFVTQAGVPRQPEAPKAVIGEDSNVVVTWPVGKDGGMAIQGYDVQMCSSRPPSQSPDTRELDGRTVYSGASTRCSIARSVILEAVSSATPRVRFRVQARNAMGCSQWSTWSVALDPSPAAKGHNASSPKSSASSPQVSHKPAGKQPPPQPSSSLADVSDLGSSKSLADGAAVNLDLVEPEENSPGPAAVPQQIKHAGSTASFSDDEEKKNSTEEAAWGEEEGGGGGPVRRGNATVGNQEVSPRRRSQEESLKMVNAPELTNVRPNELEV